MTQVSPACRSAFARRMAVACVLAAVLGAALPHAQIPGRNVNMVSGTEWPGGDPFLQRQNEPSIAASTRNPLHLLAGANDYRTVDLPGLPDGEETGDAWVGLFKSTDGGNRWKSTLLPGYPQDPNRANEPLGVYAAAADPVLRAGTNGLVYYAGLAFNRGEQGASAVFVSRFIDNNNQEAGDPFAYLGTRMVAAESGVDGRFVDKPWLAVDIPRGTGGTCHIVTPSSEPNAPPIEQTIPAGAAYVAYTSFSGDGTTLRSEILFSWSADCGVTWSAPQRLSPNDDSLNQGASIAIDPATGNVYVAWRRFTRPDSNTTSADGLFVARSINFGRKFDPSSPARRMPRGKAYGLLVEKMLEHRKSRKAVEVTELSQFDQPSSASSLAFRTNSYPTIAFDDRSRLYMAWAERGFSSVRPDPIEGDAKIVMSSSRNGTSWTTPVPVSETYTLGHQVMPSLAFAGGKLMLAYYDLREDIVQLSQRFIADIPVAFTGKRHTVDLRASMGTPGEVPSFAPSVRVSDYLIGHRPGGPSAGAKLMPCGTLGERLCEQLQFNPPNLPMFKLGTTPFLGDYIDIAPAPAFVPVGRGGWAYNTAANSVPIFHAVWTDNRDVRPPTNGNWTQYAPPGPAIGRPSILDPNVIVTCDVSSGNAGSRNQNIYTARITGGLHVGSPGNTKPLSPDLQRGFVVFAQNATTTRKYFRMRVVSQPVGGRATFDQLADPPVTFLDVAVPPRSTASRTLFVTSSDPEARVDVEVVEISALGATDPLPGGLKGYVYLNADIENPTIENADIENADIENADIENTELTNADIENPTIRVADIENADIENADIENADIENADIENADIENADIENADIENADIENASIADVTWNVTNTGNTTTAFNVSLFLGQQNLPGVFLQLVLHKSYTTPTFNGCDLKLRSNTVLINNITSPVFVTPESPQVPDPNDPALSNGTIWLAPGETGKITLRIRDTDPTNNVPVVNDKGETIFIDENLVPNETVTPFVIPQEIGTEALADGVTEPEVITPNRSTLIFIPQPLDTPIGQALAPIRVQVRDLAGAVVPGATVQLTLHVNPTGALLTGETTAVTDENGVALFTNLRVSKPGTGYQLRAAVSIAGVTIQPADSAPFDIVSLVVTNTNDSGPGSLRQAVINANANAGAPDAISFALSGAGPHSIALTSALPVISDPVSIDGSTQPGYAGTPLVELNGAALPAGTGGLTLTSGGSLIRGLAINRFSGPGIGLVTGGENTIAGNWLGIGLDPAGAVVARPNGSGIVILNSSGNAIGSGAPADRNVISGNTGSGISLQNTGNGNTIAGNYIGVDPSGEGAIANGGGGIAVLGGLANTAIRNNLISGNGGHGIRLAPVGEGNPAGTDIRNNTIGLTVSGARLGNGDGGVEVQEAPGTIIGAPGAGNVISANEGRGITVEGAQSTGVRIQGNYIGTNPDGTEPRGNSAAGIMLTAPGVIIGWAPGDGPNAGNVISGNGGDGVAFFAGSFDSLLRGNYIGTNADGMAALGSDVPSGVLPAGPLGNHQGVYVASHSVTVGGAVPEARNVISGNRIDGVMLVATLGTVQGNFIGPDRTGLKPIGNGWDGVGILTGAGNTTVLGNIIAASGTPDNPRHGMYVETNTNTIAGNWIGTNALGTAFGNAGAGIYLASGSFNTIGGSAANVIAHNASAGVWIVTGTQNRVLSNQIHSNGSVGIDLGPFAVTGNDDFDIDAGANDLQNSPVLDGAAVNATAGKTYVPLSLDTQAGTYRIQVFTSTSCDPTGYGEGHSLLLDTTVNVPQGGAGITVLEAPAIAIGTRITATATSPTGNTSEFSNCVNAVATGAVLWSRAAGGNDHFYEYIAAPQLSWPDANGQASARSLMGRAGSLVTLTSITENAFVAAKFPFRVWIGLTDADVEGTYRWVTGELFAEANWAPGEPNNGAATGFDEDYIEMFGNGQWNDNRALDPIYPTSGYIVEYARSIRLVRIDE